MILGEAAIARQDAHLFPQSFLYGVSATTRTRCKNFRAAAYVFKAISGCNIAALGSEQLRRGLATTQIQASWPRGWLSAGPKTPGGATQTASLFKIPAR